MSMNPPPNSSPSETLSLYVIYNPNKEVTLSGSLLSQSGAVANQTINFGGAVSGTATTNSQGQYSVTLKASQLGQVTAASADGLSNTAQAMLMAGMAPTITNFSAVPEGGGLWLFTGQVTGAPTQGEVINFDGLTALAGKSCNVNPNGTFSYYCYIPSGQGGLAVADAVDWWGDTSSDATTTVVC
jgi:hypothetical protein